MDGDNANLNQHKCQCFSGTLAEEWLTGGDNPLEGRGCEEPATQHQLSPRFCSLCMCFVQSWKVTQLFLIKVTQKSGNKQGVIAKTPSGSQASSSWFPGPEVGKGIIKNNALQCP